MQSSAWCRHKVKLTRAAYLPPWLWRFCLLLAELLAHVYVHHLYPSDRIGSVSRGWVSQWQNVFIHSGLLRWLLLKLDAWAIHVRHCLNILNGSVVVQLLDSWTNTSSSIKLVMDTLQPGCASPPHCKTHKSCGDPACSPSTKPSRSREKQQIVNIIYHF